MTATDIESRANALAEHLHLQQSPVPRKGVDRYIASKTPKLEPSTVLAYVVERGWLIVEDRSSPEVA